MKKRFDISQLVWHEQSKQNREALDRLMMAIRENTTFSGKINKNESCHVARKFHHFGVVCWERKLDSGNVERWVEVNGRKITDVETFIHL